MSMQATGEAIAAPRPAFSRPGLWAARSRGIVVSFWIVTALLCGAGFALFYKYYQTIRPH